MKVLVLAQNRFFHETLEILTIVATTSVQASPSCGHFKMRGFQLSVSLVAFVKFSNLNLYPVDLLLSSNQFQSHVIV